VSEYVITALREQGVSHFFIDLGGLNDAFMPPLAGLDGVRTVVAAFEGGAAYMADGYARASGGIGVCLGIGGPGILNMTTALAAAKADRSPVIAISGEVARSWEGMGGFQDASGAALDDCAALRPVTGLSLGLSSRAVVPHHLRHAITHVMTDRAPAHLSIPVDVQRAEIDVPIEPVADALLRPQTIDEDAIAHVVETLHRPGNERIVLLAGAGVLHADGIDALRAFAERFDVPVATTLSGRGVFPETHPLALGVFGYGGSRWAIDAIRSPDVDVLMIVGSGLSQRDTMQWDPAMLPAQALVHIDADPMLIGRTWPSEIPVVSNPAVALQRLATLDATAGLDAGRETRRAFLAGITASGPNQYDGDDTSSDAVPMHPARVVAELRAAFPTDGVLCVDSGAHRAWFAEYWTVHEPGTHLSLTNLGPMGGAVPLGIGAKLARPDRPLMVATGDGCMLMHGMELHTAAREQVPMIVAVMNNHSYGNIWFRAAELGPGPEHLTDISGVDWVGFARSMGADGERVEEPGAIAAAVERALAAPGPYLLDLVTDKTYPTPVAVWRDRVHSWHDDD
jgi:acetolactate synthase-1/2/3 large subunit